MESLRFSIYSITPSGNEIWAETCKRIELENCLTSYVKTKLGNLKWIKDINVGTKTIKH